MKKILPISNEVIAHGPLSSYILAIIQNHEETKEWELYHFLHIAVSKNLELDYFYPKMMWDHCPFILKYDIPYSYIKKGSESIIEFIKWAIYNEFYVYMLINTKYIEEYKTTADNDHNPMIYGIDEELQVIHMQDFFQRKYKSITVSFKSIEQAFLGLVDVKDYNQYQYCSDLGPVTLLQYNTDAEFKFDLGEFKKELKEYRDGTNFYNRDGQYWKNSLEGFENICGHKVYDWVAEHVPTTRIMSLFYKHACYWKQRIEYLLLKNIIAYDERLLELGEQLQSKSHINLYYYLKLQYSKKLDITKYRAKLKEKLIECRDIENKIMDYFLSV